MSCVVGIVYEGNVYLGSDSAGTSDSCQLLIYAEPKVFRIGAFVLGCAGSFRIAQILRYLFTPPPLEGDLMRYMVASFVPALKECLKADEPKSEDLLCGSRLLVGVQGRLFCIYMDFHVEETIDEYNAIGSADDVAYGALYGTQHLWDNPIARLRIALEAAQKYYTSVREPFVYVNSLEEQEVSK
jgi:hypothetical protein